MSNAPTTGEPRPEPPRAPEPWECCRSGCDTCVYDLYWATLERFEQARRDWEGRWGPADMA